MPTPILQYDFENYTAGSTTVVNKGSLGTGYNATLYGTASVTSTMYATGTSCLQLIGHGSSSGGYLQVPNFNMYNALGAATSYAFTFWFKKLANTIDETNARIFDYYRDSTNYLYVYFNVNGCLILEKNDGSYGYHIANVTNVNVCDNKWHHCAIVNSNHTYTSFFLDGIRALTTNDDLGLTTSQSVSFYLGRSSNSTHPYSTVYIDDFRLYNWASAGTYLRQADINSLVSIYSWPSCNFYIGNPPINLSQYFLQA